MDPLTIAYLAKTGIDLGRAVFGASQARKASDQLDEIERKGLPRFQTAQEYFDMYRNAQRDRAMEAEISESRETLAANLTALERAGSRALLGGTQAQAEIQRETVAQAAQRGFQREQAALGDLAAAQQRTMDANITAEQAERTRKLLEAQMGYQAGMETALSGLQGAAAAGIGAADRLGGMKKTPEYDSPFVSPTGLDEIIDTPEPKELSIADMAIDESAIADIDQPEDIGDSGLFEFDAAGFIQDPYSQLPFYLRPEYQSLSMLPSRGVYREQGGSVKLKGEFDHSTNPKYVYDKNGNVEAEMTGDETLVFNPKQRRFLKKVLKDLMTKGKATANKAEANKTFKAFK